MATPGYIFVVPLIVTLVAGCTMVPEAHNAQIEIDRQIIEASQKIQSAQADLYQAGALNQITPKVPISITDDYQRITLLWQGDVVQLLHTLAHDRGLGFASMGVRVPLPVNIDIKNAPYDVVMQMLRAQIGYRAEIIQRPDMILLHYNRPQ